MTSARVLAGPGLAALFRGSPPAPCARTESVASGAPAGSAAAAFRDTIFFPSDRPPERCSPEHAFVHDGRSCLSLVPLHRSSSRPGGSGPARRSAPGPSGQLDPARQPSHPSSCLSNQCAFPRIYASSVAVSTILDVAAQGVRDRASLLALARQALRTPPGRARAPIRARPDPIRVTPNPPPLERRASGRRRSRPNGPAGLPASGERMRARHRVTRRICAAAHQLTRARLPGRVARGRCQAKTRHSALSVRRSPLSALTRLVARPVNCPPHTALARATPPWVTPPLGLLRTITPGAATGGRALGRLLHSGSAWPRRRPSRARIAFARDHRRAERSHRGGRSPTASNDLTAAVRGRVRRSSASPPPPDGGLTSAPRGDPAGLHAVLDDRRLLIPERPGNRLADTLTNLLVDPRIALLFLIPGWATPFASTGARRSSTIRPPGAERRRGTRPEARRRRLDRGGLHPLPEGAHPVRPVEPRAGTSTAPICPAPGAILRSIAGRRTRTLGRDPERAERYARRENLYLSRQCR